MKFKFLIALLSVGFFVSASTEKKARLKKISDLIIISSDKPFGYDEHAINNLKNKYKNWALEVPIIKVLKSLDTLHSWDLQGYDEDKNLKSDKIDPEVKNFNELVNKLGKIKDLTRGENAWCIMAEDFEDYQNSTPARQRTKSDMERYSGKNSIKDKTYKTTYEKFIDKSWPCTKALLS